MAHRLLDKLDYFKLLYLKILLSEIIDSPLDAINAAKFVHCAKKDSNSSQYDTTFKSLDEESIEKFSMSAQNITVEEIQNALLINESYYLISDTDFCVDRRGLHVENYFYEKVDSVALGKLSVWDAIRISSVFSKVENLILERIQSDAVAQGMDVTSEEYIIELRSLKKALFSVGVDCCLKPEVLALLNKEKASLGQKFIGAEAVFSVCEAQLSAGRVPEAAKADVDQLVDETVKGLSGNFGSQRYLSIVDRLPLQHPACRIIAGVALAFAGLVLAAISITLAVHSFGVSTPLSAVGVAVGVDLMLAGFAVAAAAASLAMASSSVFFAKSQVQDLVALTEIKDSARAFSKVAGG